MPVHLFGPFRALSRVRLALSTTGAAIERPLLASHSDYVVPILCHPAARFTDSYAVLSNVLKKDCQQVLLFVVRVRSYIAKLQDLPA